MIFVDTHTHLYLEQFDDDRNDVVEKAVSEGVSYMLLPNIDSETIVAMNSLSRQFPGNCFPMMGLHPTSVKDDYEAELELVEEELFSGKYIAIGEIGIDLYWDKTYREQQLDAMRRQLALARKLKLPVSIHTRESFEDVYSLVKQELTDDLTGIFHCFTGTAEQAKLIMETGFKMGIGGVLTFKNSKLDEVIKDVPAEFLVLETDAPFLSPVPHRGKRNESSYIRIIAEKLADIKKVSVEEIADVTTRNASRLFNITI